MKISEINIYPVKSLGGISVEKSIVEKRGLQYDRQFMLADQNGKFITQREFPQMATLRPQVREGKIEINCDEDFETLRIPFEFKNLEEHGFGKEFEVQIWKSKCEALLANDFINDWFSEVLKTDCRLVEMPDSTNRLISQQFNKGTETVSFADGYPVLLIGENSLNDLNEKLEVSLPMNRFRPNIVTEGSEKFAEDKWKKIRIGKTVFRSTKPCARCVMTTINQKTGITDANEPLKTLAAYRKASQIFPDNYAELDLDKNAVLFGQNLVPENYGEEIKIGDEIEIIE